MVQAYLGLLFASVAMVLIGLHLDVLPGTVHLGDMSTVRG